MKNINIIICPKCSEELSKNEGVFRCRNGHSFDVSASGYLNLLLGSKPGEFTGDNREMVASRRQFLETGAYQSLREALCGEISGLIGRDSAAVVDFGCGEGYYTREIAATVSEKTDNFQIVGIDISKAATLYASKRDKITQYITASCFHSPIREKSADVVTSVFAPVPDEEIGRILKDDGTLVAVVPGAEHLWELKQKVYDTPYLNDENKHAVNGFEEIGRHKLKYKCTVASNENITALFSMTPYAHRTPAEGKKRLEMLTEMELTLSFVISSFRKK